ncbi:hypothetical protein [Micromonospora mangrovi]|uniref:Polymorphic outer membrane protein repeat-containing protein n=1 Tax=Micromonospora sp. CCTCC AA 2012012 TaxID=3111921 RepID=A0AAU7MAK2_9ACTN
MSNNLRNNDDATRETTSPIRRRRLWLATGVVGLTGAVSLAGVAYATTGATGPHRLADVKWSTAQQVSDDNHGDEQGDEKDRDARNAEDQYGRDGKGRDERGEHGRDKDRDRDDHGRVREVPCDDEKLIEAVDLANRDHGGTLKLAPHCTYELSFSDRKAGAALPTIRQEITIKGEDSTIKRDSEDAFRLFRVADGGDLTLKDVTLKGGNAAEFKYGQAPSTSTQGGQNLQAPQGGQGGAAPQGGQAVQAPQVVQAPQGAQAAAAPQGAQAAAAPQGVPASAPQAAQAGLSGAAPHKGGEADGGALLVEHGGSAHLEKVKLIGNNAEGNGGAIANYGRVDLAWSTVEDNHARENGGGIFNTGLLKVKESHVAHNTAGDNGGGIANGRGKKEGYPRVLVDGRDEAGSVEIFKSSIEGNQAGENGGGLFSSGGFLQVSYSFVKENTACRNGGGIYAEDTDIDLDHVVVAKNHANYGGGGVVNTGGKREAGLVPGRDERQEATATIADSKIVDNTAGGFGGGIFNGEWLVKVEEGFAEGPEGRGDNATLTLRDTEIKGNTALNGGGIFNNKGTVTLTKTRVTKNTATDSSKLHRVAGGILNIDGRVKLDETSTVTDNDPTNCAGTVKDCFN